MSLVKILEFRLRAMATSVLIFTAIASTCAQGKNSITWLEFRYGYHIPLSDLADRFGGSTDLGLGIEAARLKGNVFLGADGSFFFGNKVKEDVLAGLRSFDGTIIGKDGRPGDVNLKERGWYIGLNAGKIFPTSANENNLTGIRGQIGAGLLQHKVRVQDNSESIFALKKENLKGYDRLTNGAAIHLAVGFQYHSPKNNLHFSLMGDMYAARTQSRRDFDYPTSGYLSGKRMDLLAGMTLAYIVTISRNSKPDHIYY